MKRWLSVVDWPIGLQLMVISLAVTAAVGAALTGLGVTMAEAGLQTEAENALRADAALVAKVIDDWNTSRLNELRAIAKLPQLKEFQRSSSSLFPEDLAEIRADLEALAQPGIDSISVLNADGTIVVSTSPTDVGVNLRQRDYFRLAMGGSPYVSGVSISLITRNPAIFYAVPIFGRNGAVLGVVRSRTTLAYVNRTLNDARNRVGLGSGGEIGRAHV